MTSHLPLNFILFEPLPTNHAPATLAFLDHCDHYIYHLSLQSVPFLCSTYHIFAYFFSVSPTGQDKTIFVLPLLNKVKSLVYGRHLIFFNEETASLLLLIYIHMYHILPIC